MVTPELADFIRIEMERNVSQEAIASKLLAVGWSTEDIAEGLTETKISTTPQIQTPNIENVQPAKLPTENFDPYRESPQAQGTTFTFKVPPTPQKESAPLMPDLRPKDFSEGQNRITSIPENKPEVEASPALEQYQNNLDKVVVPASSMPTVVLTPRKSHHFFRTLFFIILIILLCGGGVFAYTQGYIKLPFEIPFLKKDPHQILAQVPGAMANTTSFKSQMDVKATFPAVAQLIGMLMGGGENPSTNTDFITAHNTFSYSDTPELGKQLEATFVGSSSLIDKSVTLDLRALNGISYLKISSGESLFPNNISIPTNWISISKSDIDSLYELAKKDGKYIPPQDQKDATLNLLSQFSWESVLKLIPADSNIVIKENPSEKVSGVDAYHYSIAVDGAMTKKIIHSLAASYGFKVTDAEWTEVDKTLSAVSVDTFDVWVGKSDMRLYKTNITLIVPLTKVLKLEDKNLSQNSLRLDFTNTYQDFNVPITVNTPEEVTPLMQVVDSIEKSQKDASIKEMMQTLTFSFGRLRDVEKSYGYKSNSSGSCANPTVGSLYSPTGHKKSAGEAVAMIAQNIISFISMSDGQSLCYSTPSLWSISAPTATDPTKYFCADNTGTLIELPTAPTTAVCK